MIELRVLGPLRIDAADGRSLEALVRQTRRAALLAYLGAASPRGAHRRDKLLALFWPESDETHARAALSQAVYVLRSALGQTAIASHGDGLLGLDPDVVWCDAAALEAALEAGRPAEALALYRGDLLDGFFIDGAPEFEHWLDRERERLRRLAAKGAWARAETNAAAGDRVGAGYRARQAASLSEGDEVALRRLMEFLHALGDRAGAISAYETFAWRLAEGYEIEPSPETTALAAQIRAEGPRGADPVPVPALPAPVVPVHRGRRVASARIIAGAFAAAAVAATVAAFGWGSLRPAPSPSQPVTRFSLDFSDAPPLSTGIGGSTIAVSPDGARLVYVGDGTDGRQLFLRSMDRLGAEPVPQTEGAKLPFFSPDGEWIGFVVGTAIRRVPAGGGPAITVWDAGTNIPGASWGPRGFIVFATPSGLWHVPAAGGVARALAVADTARGQRYRWPTVLPSGRVALFTSVDQAGFRLATVSLRTGAVALLGLEGTHPIFVPPGHLVFAHPNGGLFMAAFDPVALRLTGAPVPLADAAFVGIAGAAKLGVSGTGVLAYVPEQRSDRTLVLVDRAGEPIRALDLNAPASPRYSPDGSWIAVSEASSGPGHADIWLVDPARNTRRRLTSDSGSVAPVWSPDGRQIAVANKPGGRPYGWRIRQIAVDGDGPAETLADHLHGQVPLAFAPDGRALVFQKPDAEGRTGLWVLPLEGERSPTAYAVGPGHAHSAAFSPDGRWLAYVSDLSGRDEVYVAGFPVRGAPVRVSSAGGTTPRWSRAAPELFYRGPAGVVAVTVEAGTELRVGASTVLFDDRAFLSPDYDVHPEGQRFAMIRTGPERAAAVVVLNLF